MNDDLQDICRAAPPFDRETIREEFRELAKALYRDKYYSIAAALARFVVEEQSLEQAFGLIRPGRGAPPRAGTLDRDVRILEASRRGHSYFEIADLVGVNVRTVGALCRPDPDFEKRNTAALSEILGKGPKSTGG